MNIHPFDKPGRFYRGNLHTHSTASDGALSPRAVCASYRRRGYDFISLTDHFREVYGYPVSDTTPFRTDRFTTVLGAELHAPETSLGDDWHILAVGLPLDFEPTGSHETGAQLAARARDAGAYVAAAHPAWYDLTDSDIQSLPAASAIEIFNTTCQEANGKGDSVGYLDRLLSQGHFYHAIATDDAHFQAGRPDVGRNWVMVRSSHLEPAALLEALHAGSFYASQGPQILDVEVARDGKKLARDGKKLRTHLPGAKDVYLRRRGGGRSRRGRVRLHLRRTQSHGFARSLRAHHRYRQARLPRLDQPLQAVASAPTPHHPSSSAVD